LAKIIKPITSFALPAVIMVAFLSLFINPWAVRTADQYKSQLKSRDELSTLNPGTFKESKSSDRVFYVESFDELGSAVKNIFVQTKQHNKLGVVIANNGHREISSKGDNYIILQKGRRYEGIPNTKEFSTTEFDQYGILTAQQPVEPYTESIDSKKLSDVIKSNTLEDRLEFQWRIASPISCILLVFLAIPLSFTNPRAGRSLNIIFAVLIFIIYNNLLAIMNTFITLKKVNIVIGFWPIHFIFLIAAVYLTYKRSMNQPLFSLKNMIDTK
ncbi:MAG TPA: LPS export ABC transporter permease LptF, partial [Methylophilaceae bacterium]|nr:LPS export ABC transporter permease LptF [Methylophilaceae bacterium]